MAVTKIWKVKGSFSAPLKYVENEEKTRNPLTEEGSQSLDDVIAYAANEDKTEQKYFVSSLNCDREHARDEFLMTKQRFGKEDGIVAYHAYQSFAEEDISPQLAHQIGVAFAKELWGDRFQVVIATHLNTEHVHNHFVINSVSFRDGKKYHDSRAAYRRMQEVSDRLCREHDLQVIEQPQGKGSRYYLNQLEKAGMPTRYNVARAAIDEAISRSVNMEEFKYELKSMGYQYQFSMRRKYWTITPAGWDRPIRLHQLGEDYTRERIEQRVYENDIGVRERKYARAYFYRPDQYNLRRRVDRIMGKSGLQRLYLRYCYELGYLPKYTQRPQRLHPLLREDLLKCEMYSQEARLLCRNGIETENDLLLHMNGIEEKMTEIMEQREELRKLVKRSLPEEEKQQAKSEIAKLTVQLKDLRKEKRLCLDIKQRSHRLEETLEKTEQDLSERKRVRER